MSSQQGTRLTLEWASFDFLGCLLGSIQFSREVQACWKLFVKQIWGRGWQPNTKQIVNSSTAEFQRRERVCEAICRASTTLLLIHGCLSSLFLEYVWSGSIRLLSIEKQTKWMELASTLTKKDSLFSNREIFTFQKRFNKAREKKEQSSEAYSRFLLFFLICIEHLESSVAEALGFAGVPWKSKVRPQERLSTSFILRQGSLFRTDRIYLLLKANL